MTSWPPLLTKQLAGIYADLSSASAFPFKTYHSIGCGEQRVIAASADINARMDFRSALTVNNVSRFDELSVGAFCTETFRMRVTTVFGTPDPFFRSEKL